MIRVVLVDDQALVRTGLARILSPADGFDVVAQCADGAEAVRTVPGLSPDIVVMDVRMPTLGGIEATAQLRRQPEAPPVLILTTFDEDDVLWAALQAGASGFILKDATAEDLLAAVRAVAAGAAWFDRAVTPRVLAAYRRSVAAQQSVPQRAEQLSEREQAVLQRMARGATNGEIALDLHVSEATVKSHVGSIFAKLGVRDRPAAIVYAFDHGIVVPPSG